MGNGSGGRGLPKRFARGGNGLAHVQRILMDKLSRIRGKPGFRLLGERNVVCLLFQRSSRRRVMGGFFGWGLLLKARRLVLVNRNGVLPISRVGGRGGGYPDGGRREEDGCGCALDGVKAGDFVKARNSEASPSADFAATEVEAVGADGLLPVAYDLSECGAAFALGLLA